MKKIILLIIIFALVLVSAGAMSGCSQDAPIPGVAWAATETLTYEIKEGDTRIGTLTVTSQRLAAGDHKIDKLRSEPFKISGMAAGSRITKIAKDTEGKEIMYSESLLNGFTSLASYKKIDFNGKQYEHKVYHEGKNFYYSKNGNNYQKIKAKSGYADNELLYNIIRCYDISGGYNTSYSVLSPLNDSLEKITVNAAAATDTFELNYTDRNDEAQKKVVKTIRAVFGKSDSPSGEAMAVWYSSEFELLGNIATPNNKSLYIPVKIVENNLTYTLIDAQAV